jgi:hypothetical protein
MSWSGRNDAERCVEHNCAECDCAWMHHDAGICFCDNCRKNRGDPEGNDE